MSNHTKDAAWQLAGDIFALTPGHTELMDLNYEDREQVLQAMRTVLRYLQPEQISEIAARFTAGDEGDLRMEYLLRKTDGESLPYGAVRTDREKILEDREYVNARWGGREAVGRVVGPWQVID